MKTSALRGIFILGFLLVTGWPSKGLAQVPAPSSSPADRIGIYAWGFEATAWQSQTNGQIDRLNWAADKAAVIGSRTIRVTLPGAIYGLPVSGDLAEVAAGPEYDKLFTDPRFKTYLLTVTTGGAFFDPVYPWSANWFDGYTPAEYAATRAEIGRLGDYLLDDARFAGRTFIILNWEADNEILPHRDRLSSWDAFTDWINSLADGVNDARSRHPNSQARLYSGFEFNLVAREGQPCGAAVADPVRDDPLKHRCAVDYIAPSVKVDYYSYSSWQTLDVKFEPEGSYKAALRRDLDFALALIHARRPGIEEHNFMIGEFGIHRTRWSEKVVANYAAEMIDAVMAQDAFQVSYAVWWQIIDNLQFNLVWDEGFGLYRSRNGLFYLNLVGETFKKRLAGDEFVPLTGGPLLRRSPPGVLNAATGGADFAVNPNSRINVMANGTDTPFSPTGNRIHIEQMMNSFLVSADNAPDFTESSLQLSATLPQGLRPGSAFIQALDAAGVETQGQTVVFNCDACPAITEITDSDRNLGEFHPGTMIDIHGRNFSTDGNSVIIEQQDVLTGRYRFTVAAEDVLFQSSTRLRVKLPAELIITRFNVVIVASRDGLESNMQALRAFPYSGITPPCPDCAPVISLAGGVLTRDGGSGNLLPGTIISIRGARFSPSGNIVVLQQGLQRFIMEKNSEWSESSERIDGALPAGLQPGRAVVYVVNAFGQEGAARKITIARGIQPVRQPIRRGETRKTP
ncbi:MAG: hypothetical protein IPM66_06805 [Acidobacteriota bacterium]|nr:MAG: hypothetical protein IPM66_06805 [Acidobacteriota bacterium]